MESISSRNLVIGAFVALLQAAAIAAELSPSTLMGMPVSALREGENLALPNNNDDGVLDPDFVDLPSTSVINALVSARSVDLTVRGRREVDLNNKIAPATVLVMGMGTCTGTIISPDGRILTCWHCVQGKDEVHVRLHPSIAQGEATLLRANIEAIDQKSDLALLRLASPPKKLPTISIGQPSDLEVGSDVFAIGHPSGLHWTFVKGHISQVHEQFSWMPAKGVRHEASVVQSQLPLYEGNSGGGLISERGTLIGVNATKREGEAFTFAVGLPAISQFLANAKAGDLENAMAKAPRVTNCTPRTLEKRRHEESKATVAFIDSKCRQKPDSVQIVFDDGRPTLVARISESSDSIDLVLSKDKKGQHLYLEQKAVSIERSGSNFSQRQ